MSKISVLIVDDNVLLRMGLSEAISREKDMELVGEGSNGAEAFDLYSELKPDVVVMDYRMPLVDGVDATKRIVAEFPEAQIILLSVYEGEEDIWNAWNAGVRGYISKSEAAESLQDAIRCVADGDSYFPAAIYGKLASRKERGTLSPRELQVLQLIVDGLSNKEIEARLNLSQGTVKLHVRNMLEKLGVADRTQAAVLALKSGIIRM